MVRPLPLGGEGTHQTHASTAGWVSLALTHPADQNAFSTFVT
jgi:hypothetical protein